VKNKFEPPGIIDSPEKRVPPENIMLLDYGA